MGNQWLVSPAIPGGVEQAICLNHPLSSAGALLPIQGPVGVVQVSLTDVPAGEEEQQCTSSGGGTGTQGSQGLPRKGKGQVGERACLPALGSHVSTTLCRITNALVLELSMISPAVYVTLSLCCPTVMSTG